MSEAFRFFLACFLAFFFPFAFWWLTLWVKMTCGSFEATGRRANGVNGCVIAARSGPHGHQALIPAQGHLPEGGFHWPPGFVRLHPCWGSSRAAGSAARRSRWRSNESGVKGDAAFHLSIDAALRWLVVGLNKFCTSSSSCHFQNISFLEYSGLYCFLILSMLFFCLTDLVIMFFIYIKWTITFNSKCLHH